MTYVRLVMVEEIATDVIRTLARDFEKFHVVDMGQAEDANNKRHKLRAVACQAWEKKLQTFREIMIQQDIEPPGKGIDPVPTSIPPGDVLEAVQAYLDPIEADLGIHINFFRQQTQLINELKERIEVLRLCRRLNNAGGYDDDEESPRAVGGIYGSLVDQKTPIEEPLLSRDPESEGSEFSESLSGAVPAVKQALFERMIFRVSHGNAILSFQDMKAPVVDPVSGTPVQKVVFSVLAVKSENMRRRIKKICTFFGANVYDVPSNAAGYDQAVSGAQRKLEEQKTTLHQTKLRINVILTQMAGTRTESPMVNWIDALKKERLIAEVMKKTTMLQSNALGQSSQQQMIRAVGWVPSDMYFGLESIVDRMNKERFRAQQVVLSKEDDCHGSPPTYFETNKFTSGFQAIVDTYGMCRYQEVNPGLFTIVTFPFLFGVMYGDMLHAALLFCFASYLLIYEKKLLYEKKIGQMGEMFAMAFGGRYIIFMMAIFGFYAGTLYNDAASIPLDIFGSRWDLEKNEMNENGPYPWGVDPEWYGKKNELVFLNSLKMKLSIILGVTHMSFGICLGLANNFHFHDYAGIFFEFIPRILFLLCTFGYMAALIILKWCMDWTTIALAPPSLIQTMIGMFLKPGSLKEEDEIYSGQGTLQIVMLAVALACVPTMLVGKPLMANAEFKKKYGHLRKGNHVSVNADEEHKIPLQHEEDHGGDSGHGEVGPNYSFSDHMITQSIHTIEFVLGAVSNTASYLRLWALSLAHAQLASVFWKKMMMDYGILNGPFFAFIGFGAWAGATTAVLLCMDVLECFLHALRLHWVEFQNKFFFAEDRKSVV